MKQLIPQSKIDEAAKLYSLNSDTDRLQEIEDNETYDFTEYIDSAVKHGVQFALNEIQPLMVEFAEWFFVETDKFTRPNLYSVVEWSSLDNTKLYTTEQLLEEFINSKNK